MTKIRQAPSGPDIQNASGGLLDVGPGLPQAVYKTHLTAISSIPSSSAQEIRSDMTDPASAQDFRVTVTEAKGASQYIARLRFDLRMLANYAGDDTTGVSLYADSESAVQTFLGQTNVILSGSPGIILPSHVDFETNPFLASALAGWSEGEAFTVYAILSGFTVAPADSIQLYSAGQVGTALLEVTELF